MLVGWLLLRRAPYGLTVGEGFKNPSHGNVLFHMKMMRHGEKGVSLMKMRIHGWTRQSKLAKIQGNAEGRNYIDMSVHLHDRRQYDRALA